MTTVNVTKSTTATAEQFLAGLTDFGPRRGEIFGNSDGSKVTVHDQGDGWADITEGSAGGIWERLRYDWSNPAVISLKTTDSNLWANTSSWTYSLKPGSAGGTDVDLVAVRNGKGFRGVLVGILFALGGKSLISGSLEKSLRAIEARNA
ncbi:MAG: hypothetical protein JWR36_2406 [Glaciihabitans sp.]|nr:hypothetical protein [Glaciihabitans sp.]MDQ1570599.1 hypothetical protein [Actinomycetota bacterium]